MAVRVELQHLMGALAACPLHDLDRISRLGGGEADRLERNAGDRQPPARRAGRKGYSLVARLDRARLGLDHLTVDAGLDARLFQLAVDVLHHRIHRARRRPHLRQVDIDRLASGRGFHRNPEPHIALEGGDLVGQGAVVDRAGQIFGIVAWYGRGRLALRGRDALNHAHAFELSGIEEIHHLRHAGSEPPRQLLGLHAGDPAFARAVRQGLKHGQPLIQGENLAVVA